MPEKSPEELLARFQNAPDADFLPLLVHDLRGSLGDMMSAAKLIQSLLREAGHTEEPELGELSQILLTTAENMRLILDVAMEYHRARLNQNSDNHA
jgi:hypothetical protein